MYLSGERRITFLVLKNFESSWFLTLSSATRRCSRGSSLVVGEVGWVLKVEDSWFLVELGWSLVVSFLEVNGDWVWLALKGGNLL